MAKQEKVSKSYLMLTDTLKNNNLPEYELGLILVLADEYKASYKKVEIHNPTSLGTEVDYTILRSEDEKEEYREYLVRILEAFKNKYNRWDLTNILDID